MKIRYTCSFSVLLLKRLDLALPGLSGVKFMLTLITQFLQPLRLSCLLGILMHLLLIFILSYGASARNDALFSRKLNKPYKVHAAAKAILQGTCLDDQTMLAPLQVSQGAIQPGHTVYDLTSFAWPVFFVDAAWKMQQGHHSAPAGL